MRLLLAAVAVLAGCGKSGPPYVVKNALKTFAIDPAFRIEEFASEPMIADPVAMEIDEDGRIYVVQNSGYPLDTEHGLGRVWLLEDTNGDGRPDRSTLFADKLILPTGVMRWKKGVLVTDAPNVWYLEDTDGDGKADVKKAMLTGFAFTNPQHTVNNPVYGLDNWIYLAHEGFTNAVVFADKFGDRGSDIQFGDGGGKAVKNERRNVRLRPDTHQLETTSSSSQFGIAFDDWGHLITANNSNHARHEVIASRYLARNPDLLTGSAMQDVSDHGSAAPVFAITKNPRFELLTGAGIFTSACGITWFQGGTVIAEPVHNLVHRDLWKQAGATFTARRARESVEFLASTDPWFRPVNFYNGPDGALYVLDYYRRVLEHPEWTSREVYESKDIYDGNTLGRIYRIVPAAGGGSSPLPRLSKAADEDLVRMLDNPNVWWRRTAQRLLVDRKSTAAMGPLAKRTALGRLHALWTLDGLGKLDDSLIQEALGDSEPGVRENAIVLAESRLPNAKLEAALSRMQGDADARVRFQLLATLGAKASKQILSRDIEDRWVQMAALSASGEDAAPAFESAVRAKWTQSAGRAGYFQQVCSVIGSRGRSAEMARVLSTAAAAKGEWWRSTSLDGLAAGLRAKRGKLVASDTLSRLFADGDAGVRHGALRLIEIAGLPPGEEAMLKRAMSALADRTAQAELRADALSLVALKGESAEFFQKFVIPGEPEAVQTAAVRALSRRKGGETGKFLLAKWRSLTAGVRAEAGDAMVSDPERFRLLLDAIERGDLQPWTLTLRQRIQMQMNRDAAMRERARGLLAAKAGNREEIRKRYQSVVEKGGDVARGPEVFERVCAKCHKLNGKGAEVGPDLATVRNRTPDALLTDILIPSRAIAQMYESYVVETIGGGTLEGVMGQQTSTTITLVHEQGKQDVIPRSQIKEMRVSNLSAMPEDIDKEVTPAQMADLIAYLKKPG